MHYILAQPAQNFQTVSFVLRLHIHFDSGKGLPNYKHAFQQKPVAALSSHNDCF